MVRHRGDNLSLVPFTEFLIKLVADGFAFAPNACIRSIWNALDFIMLIVECHNWVDFHWWSKSIYAFAEGPTSPALDNARREDAYHFFSR